MAGDLPVDFEGQGEGGAAGFGGDAGRGAVTDGVEKVFKLKAEGFAFGDVGFGERESGGGVGKRGLGSRVPVRDVCRLRGGRGTRSVGEGGREWCPCRHRCHEPGVDVDGEKLLTGEVEREVLVGLEEAELADLLGGDAAGGEVGDAAGGELEADVGDVGLAGEDGKADGADLLDRRRDEREDDIEVVNHEVEDDIDVEGARREDAEAMCLKEHGAVESGDGGGDSRVEAFQMTDLDDAVVLGGEGEDVVGFGECGGEGFFDEDIDAGKQELPGDGGVECGGDADGGGVDPGPKIGTRGTQHVCDGGEGRDVVLGGEGFTQRGTGFDEGGELDEVRLGGLELAIDAEMVSPEGAGPDDGNAQSWHGYLAAGAGDSTAARQRA